MSKEDKYLKEETDNTPKVDILDRLEIEELINDTIEYLEDDELSEMAIKAAGWDKSSVKKFGKTIGKSASEHGFMNQCIARMQNKKGFDKKKAGGFCASLVDMEKGTTDWRRGPRKKKD